jgi:hypothetical protein
MWRETDHVRLPSNPAQVSRRSQIAKQGQTGLLAHCLTIALEITGAVVPDVLQRALDLVISRRPALRAVFPLGSTHHIVRPQVRVRLVREFVAGRDPATRWQKATRFATEDRMRPFDLENGPLLRATLLTVDRQRHLLVLSFDQMVIDALSAVLVVDDLVTAADAEINGGVTPAETPDAYARVCDERHNWSHSEEGRQATARRRVALDGVAMSLPWPALPDRSAPGELAHRTVTLPDRTCEALFRLAKQLRTVPFASLLAALGLMVAADEPPAGPRRAVTSMFANRATAMERSAVGWLSTRVPVPLPAVSGPVSEYVRAAHRELMRTLAAERTPWPDGSGDEPGMSVSVLYLSAELSGAEQAELRMGDARVRRLAVSFCPTGADVDLFVVEGAAMLSGESAPLAIGGTSVCVRVGQRQLDELVNGWAVAAELLVRADVATPVTDLVAEMRSS